MKFNLERLRDVALVVKELAIGLTDLTFDDNFTSFEKTVTISATSESQIRNQLKFQPTRYIIVDQTGNGLVTRSSTTDWNDNFLYLYNHGSNEVTVTVVFLR